MAEKNYINGLRGFAPRQNAPDFVLGSMIITVEDLAKWIKANEAEATEYNGKRQFKCNVLRAKNGGITFELDTWKPQPKEEPVQEQEQGDLPF